MTFDPKEDTWIQHQCKPGYAWVSK